MGALPAGAVLDEKNDGLPPGAIVDQVDSETTEDLPTKIEHPLYGKGAVAGQFDKMLGVADIVATSTPMGIGQVLSGFHGLAALFLTGGDVDYAVDRVKKVQDFWSVAPMTESGEDLLSAIAPKLSEADTKIDRYAEEKATFVGEDGQEYLDPEVATAIKTAIWGSVDIITAAIPGAKGFFNNLKINRFRKVIIKDAKRLGIDIHLDHFANDVAKAAKLIGSESAGEAATAYVTALRNAEYLARVKKNSLYLQGLNENLFVSTSPVRRMGVELAKELHQKGFDLDIPEMMNVRRSLDDMHSRPLGFGSGQNLAVHFNKFELLRKRINRRIRAAKRATDRGQEHSALVVIRDKMDDWMISEFNNAAMDNGKIIASGNALSGDAGGFNTYMSARQATVEHAWFNSNKVIADLVKKDASVDQVAQWLIGSTAMGKKGSATIINQMNLLLGPDSEAMAALRADFIFNLTEPLLRTKPDFTHFARNYDMVLKKNKPLADALGLQESDVAILAAYAKTASLLPESGTFYSPREVTSTISRLAVGHSVAKGAARVTFMTKVLNAITAIDKVTPSQIADAVGTARFDTSMIASKNPIRAGIIAAGAVSGLADDEKEEDK